MSQYPWYDVVPITDLRDMLRKSAAAFGSKAAFRVRTGEGYEGITYELFEQRVYALGAALFARGFGQGQALSAYAEGRWEWPLAYLACACGGGVNVPIDKDLREAEVRHILDRTRVAVVVTSARFLDVVLEIQPKLPHLRTVICMDPTDRAGVLQLSDLLVEGQALIDRNRTAFPQVAIDPEAPAAVIYTSGTMGSSKGVVLSQRNIAANMMDMNAAVYIDEHDTFLSVLPLHHTYECTCGMLTPLYRGCTIVYCENLRRLADQMKEVQATMLLGVPLLFESIYRKIQEGVREKGRGKFAVAKGLAGLTHRFLGLDLRKKIFHALHERFGGKLRLLISGGAAVDPAVARFFRDLGIRFLQGYGMTECAPIIAVNRPEQFQDAAAGLPLPSMEVRIEDGEICARGPNVMLGYFEDPEATADVLVDDWMHTGDLGYFDEEGFLHIQGRKKAVIVLKNGKNVYPEEVEYLLNQSPYILESLVWEGPEAGGGEVEEVHAILVPDLEKVDQYFQQQGVALSDERVEELLKREVRRQCLRLSHYKRVRRFTVRWEEFDKTTTRKIKRYLYTEKIKNI
jgi:long-chain acyl-CoA synthetase